MATTREPDPIFRDFAARILDEFPWPNADVRRLREQSLAERLALITDAEVQDLRAAEARRILRIDALEHAR